MTFCQNGDRSLNQIQIDNFNLTNFFFIWFQTQIVEWWKRFELL